MHDFFSQTTSEADDKFVSACRRMGVEPVFYLYPQRGPQGEALHTGVVHVGNRQAAKQLVLISGTHGIEGFAGAALQLAVLDRLAEQAEKGSPEKAEKGSPPFFKEKPGKDGPSQMKKGGDPFSGAVSDIGVLLIHSLNPWGMAWVRRENHDNVDLFRNFHYLDNPVTADPLYDEIMDTYAANTWDHFDLARAAAAQAALAAKYTQDEIVSAIRRGQHHRPDGMTYHGREASWSLNVFRTIVREHLGSAQQVSVIDIHTGFGAFGEGMIIAYDPPGSAKYQRISDWFANALYIPGNDADTPPHAFSPFGFIEDLCPGAEVTAKVLEYGTHAPKAYRDAFLAAHYFHHYGDVLSAAAQPWMEKFREYLYPDSDAWRDAVIAVGMERVRQDILGLRAWALDAGVEVGDE